MSTESFTSSFCPFYEYIIWIPFIFEIVAVVNRHLRSCKLLKRACSQKRIALISHYHKKSAVKLSPVFFVFFFENHGLTNNYTTGITKNCSRAAFFKIQRRRVTSTLKKVHRKNEQLSEFEVAMPTGRGYCYQIGLHPARHWSRSASTRTIRPSDWKKCRCRSPSSSLCLAVEADRGHAVPELEARRVTPVSRRWRQG